MKINKPLSLLIVVVAYVLCLLAAHYSQPFFEDYSLFTQVLLMDIVATVVIFVFSALFKNSSMYDPYWSVIPVFIALFLINAHPEGLAERQLIVLLAVSVWAVRLTLNWARGWTGLGHEDWRYGHLSQKTGKWYWLVSFSGIHLFPTLMVYMGCLPLFYAMSDTTPLGWADWLGLAVCVTAALIELVADEQLRNFKKEHKADTYIDTGIWQYSRHPNYFGEILFWLGVFIFVIPFPDGAANWTSIGVIAMFLMFQFISIPMMERRNLERKKGYETYQKKVASLIPFIKIQK